MKKLLLITALFLPWFHAVAQGTAFTYQGRLTDQGAPANSTYDLTFTLFTAASGGLIVGTSNVVNDLPISNGLFTVTLDYGVGVFNGSERWLQIAVRPGVSVGAYTNVTPRQLITATPYAITAGTVTGPIDGGLITPGTVTGTQLAAGAVTAMNIASNSITAGHLASGAAEANLTNWADTVSTLAAHGTNLVLQFFTNSGQLSVNSKRLGFAYSQLNGGTGPFNLLALGDTVPYFDEIADNFAQKLGFNGFDLPHGQFTFLTNGAWTNRAVVEGVVVTTNWPGSLLDGGPGAYIIFTNAWSWAAVQGGTIYANRLNARFIGDRASASTVRMYSKTNGGAWVLAGTMDTSGAHRPLFTNFNVLSGYYQLMISNAGAGVLRLPSAGGGGMWDTNSTGVRVSHMIAGNLDLSDVVSRATNISLPMLRDMGIHLGFWTEISGAANYLTYGGAPFAAWITNAIPRGNLVQVTPWPGDPSQAAQGQVMRQNGIIYAQPVFDGFAPWGDYFTLTNQGGIEDGVHLTAAAARTLAMAVWNACGFEGAISVAIANHTKTGQVPLRDATQAWTGLNYFDRYFTTRGPDGGIVIEDRSGVAGMNFKIDSTANVVRFSYNNNSFLELEGSDGTPSFKPSAAFHNLISLGENTRRFTSLWLAGGEVATNLAARAPYAATTAGSNAIANLNGTGTNPVLYKASVAAIPGDTNALFAIKDTNGNTRGWVDMNFTTYFGTNQASASSLSNWNGTLSIRPTSGAPMLTVTPAGVGLGTASPAKELDVHGSVAVSNSTSGILVVNAAEGQPAFTFGKANAISGIVNAHGNSYFNFNSLGTQSSPQMQIASGRSSTSGGTAVMTLLGSGHVGIGTTNPAVRLHVAGPGQNAVLLESSSTSGTWVDIDNTAPSGQRWSIVSTGPGNSDGPGRLLFFTHQDNSTKMRLETNGNLFITGTYSPSSDRNVKTNFDTVSVREILNKVVSLPISSWSFKHDAATRHIGPMAQDFFAAFRTGSDDRHIATVDADGVALAAIQGLNQKVEEKEARIAALEKELAEIKRLLLKDSKKQE